MDNNQELPKKSSLNEASYDGVSHLDKNYFAILNDRDGEDGYRYLDILIKSSEENENNVTINIHGSQPTRFHVDGIGVYTYGYLSGNRPLLISITGIKKDTGKHFPLRQKYSLLSAKEYDPGSYVVKTSPDGRDAIVIAQNCSYLKGTSISFRDIYSGKEKYVSKRTDSKTETVIAVFRGEGRNVGKFFTPVVSALYGTNTLKEVDEELYPEDFERLYNRYEIADVTQSNGMYNMYFKFMTVEKSSIELFLDGEKYELDSSYPSEAIVRVPVDNYPDSVKVHSINEGGYRVELERQYTSLDPQSQVGNFIVQKSDTEGYAEVKIYGSNHFSGSEFEVFNKRNFKRVYEQKSSSSEREIITVPLGKLEEKYFDQVEVFSSSAGGHPLSMEEEKPEEPEADENNRYEILDVWEKTVDNQIVYVMEFVFVTESEGDIRLLLDGVQVLDRLGSPGRAPIEVSIDAYPKEVEVIFTNSQGESKNLERKYTTLKPMSKAGEYFIRDYGSNSMEAVIHGSNYLKGALFQIEQHGENGLIAIRGVKKQTDDPDEVMTIRLTYGEKVPVENFKGFAHGTSRPRRPELEYPLDRVDYEEGEEGKLGWITIHEINLMDGYYDIVVTPKGTGTERVKFYSVTQNRDFFETELTGGQVNHITGITYEDDLKELKKHWGKPRGTVYIKDIKTDKVKTRPFHLIPLMGETVYDGRFNVDLVFSTWSAVSIEGLTEKWRMLMNYFHYIVRAYSWFYEVEVTFNRVYPREGSPLTAEAFNHMVDLIWNMREYSDFNLPIPDKVVKHNRIHKTFIKEMQDILNEAAVILVDRAVNI